MLLQVQTERNFTLTTLVTWWIIIRVWDVSIFELGPKIDCPDRGFWGCASIFFGGTWENARKEVMTDSFLRSVQNCYYHLIFITFAVKKKLPPTKLRLSAWNMTREDSHSTDEAFLVLWRAWRFITVRTQACLLVPTSGFILTKQNLVHIRIILSEFQYNPLFWTYSSQMRSVLQAGIFRLMLYRVIHKYVRYFRTRLRNNQDRHGRKEHINK